MAREPTLQNFISHFERFWQAHKAIVLMAYRIGLQSSGQEDFSQRLARIDQAAWDTLTNIVLQSVCHALNMSCLVAYERRYPDLDRDRIGDWVRTEGWARVRQIVANHALKSFGYQNGGQN